MNRRNCLACEANLESVPAQPSSEGQGQEPLNWDRLDAITAEETDSGTPELADDEQKPGCLARILPG